MVCFEPDAQRAANAIEIERTMAGFRFHVFDPCLITLQIAALQCLFYTTLGALLSASAHAADIDVELRLVLSAEVSSRAPRPAASGCPGSPG